MSGFYRTKQGQFAYHNFVDVPVVWVEGRNDIPFYDHALRSNRVMFQPAGDKERCKQIADELRRTNKPYVVVMDGDFEIIERNRNPHKRILYLRRYAAENYFMEKSVLNQLCCSITCDVPSRTDLLHELDSFLVDMEKKLGKLIETAICHSRMGSGICVMPPQGTLFLPCKQHLIKIAEEVVDRTLRKHSSSVPRPLAKVVQASMDKYIEKYRFVDLIPGHHAFLLIRTIVDSAVRRKNKKLQGNNSLLYATLCKFTWTDPTAKDHTKLRQQLRAACRDASRLIQ